MDENKILVDFKQSFILRGCRCNLVHFLRRLESLGMWTECRSINALRLINSKHSDYVIYCIRALDNLTVKRIDQRFATCMVLTKDWWEYYHNPKHYHASQYVRTFSLPNQTKEVEKLLITKNTPMLNFETL